MGEPESPQSPTAPAEASLVRARGGLVFVYETPALRVEVPCHGSTLVIPHSTLHERGATGELERIADAWWALAAEAGIDRIDIAYRMGDPYETYQLRPDREL